MRLGLMVGYWMFGPEDPIDMVLEAERLGLRLGVDGGSVRLRRHLAAVLARRAHHEDQAGHRHPADLGAHAGVRGDDCGDHRSPLRRPAHPRCRRLRTAGGRRLVRPVVSEADGPHTRVHQVGAHHAEARRAGDVPGRALPAAVSRRLRPRQAAQAHHEAAAREHSDLPRCRRTEERRHGDRDRRRLAAALLLAVSAGGVRRVAARA